MPLLYAVANWNDHYENSRSRIIKDLSWVPVPNAHDGDSYTQIMLMKDAAEVFTAWILILQVASKCDPRGTLIRANGEPHDPVSLAVRTRSRASWFEKSLPKLVKLGWMQSKELPANDTAPAYHPSTASRHLGAAEWKGIEGNRKEDGGAPLALRADPVLSDSSQPTEPMSHSRYPTETEWLNLSKQRHPQWPASDASAAWRHFESQGWKRGKTAIVKWQQCITTCFERWAKDPANASKVAFNAFQRPDPYKDAPGNWLPWMRQNRPDWVRITEEGDGQPIPEWPALRFDERQIISQAMKSA